MLEFQSYENYGEDAKNLVDKFFDFQNKQCKVEEDKDGNFFIERGDVDNGHKACYACLKKIIFKKDGNIDVEMCMGDDEIHYTLNITEYKTIQQSPFCQE